MTHAIIEFSVNRTIGNNTPALRDTLYGGDPGQHVSSGSVTPDRIETEVRQGEIRVHLHGILASDLSSTTQSNIENAVTSAFSDAVSLGVREVDHGMSDT